jgi:Na+-transporting methylmalonyl-CoA/oxaloacetate decarboxylase gamma subunit
MDSPLVVSLVVTGIGMLVLFLALAILYGLMLLMTTLIVEKAGGRMEDGECRMEDAGGMGQEAGMGKWRAAVIAVALARAEQELSAVGAGAPRAEGPVSAWRTLHHQRQLTLNRPRR